MSQIPLTISAPSGQSADILDVTLNAIKQVWVDSAGALHTTQAQVTSLPTLTFGTHLAAGAASYNGSAIATLTSDATSANTASTIVARDSAGAFAMGALTATSLNLSGGALSSAGAITGGPLVAAAFANSGPSNSMFGSDGGGSSLIRTATGHHLQGASGGDWLAVLNGSATFNGSLALTGALTGATTGAFSGLVTEGAWSAASNSNLSTYNIGISFGSASFAAGSSYLYAPSADNFQLGFQGTARGGNISVFANGLSSAASHVFTGAGALTALGLGTFVGLTAGTGTVQGSSDGSHVAYYASLYTAAGASFASTVHSLSGSTTVTIPNGTSGASLAVSLPASPAFAAAPNITANPVLSSPSNTACVITLSAISSSSFTLNASTYLGGSVTGDQTVKIYWRADGA